MKKIALHGIAILMALCLIISCADSPKVDEKVWDGKSVDTAWFKEDATEYTINTAAELAGLATLVNNKTDNKNTSFEGKTITLNADLDLNNKDWTPIGNADSGFTVGTTKYHAFKGTFDGDGHTIKNLKVVSTDEDFKTEDYGYYASGLFGWAKDNSEIKGLTIDGAKVDGYHYVAAVVGYTFGKVTDCTVKNAELTNTHASTEGCGDKTGAILGIMQGTVDKKMSGCKAIDCTITGSRDAGQLAGALADGNVGADCIATNVKVSRVKDDSCSHSYAGWNIQNDLYGRDLEKKPNDGVSPTEVSGT